MKLSEEQKQAINGILAAIKQGNQEIKFSGPAGSGKTTVISHLIKVLPDWKVCAFTGKAASVLRKKQVPATTIHSLIYVLKKNDDGTIAHDKHGNPIFILAPDIGCDGIIVDEASMVSKDLYDDLRSFGIPIIFVGDHYQLEPVGSDVSLMQHPDFILRQIHRNAGEIAHFCNWIRQGYSPAAFARYLREGKVIFINKFQAEAYYTQVDQIICAYNRTRVEINNKVRTSLGYAPKVPVVGDRVMCLKNNNKIGLYNGMQGVIKYLYKNNRMIFKTDDVTFDVVYDKGQFGKESYEIEGGRTAPDPFDWCYACTVHKAQGSEWDTVLVKEQKSNHWDHRRWAYTAASRAQNILLWEPH